MDSLVTQMTADVSRHQRSDQRPSAIEIAGRKIKCHWVKTTTKQGTKRAWVSDEVPGRVVKSEADMSGAKTRMWIDALDTK